MNHWPECIAFWHGASLGPEDTDLFKWSPWGHKWPHPKGTYFYICLYSKNF